MGRLAACAVVLASRAGGLYLDVPVDGRVLTIEYEASNTYTELWRYAEAFEAEHGLRRFYDQWAKCAPVIYARYKCVTSEILKAMQAHRDAAHALAKDFAYRAMGRWDAFYAAGDDAGCFALLGAFMAYAVYIALCAMKAYTVSVGNLPEPEHDSDDSAYGHSHFHGHESSDSDKED
ncbi:hypothetical protein AURANDRAFT_69031 [Aureococcus anophagefferens]|uniref:Uncharacterized protein n=1 Tax=Aureococcus anophagefferens TaxID=44056 RepID=F0YRI3_AURAN|nr:hypothetical protein AURANDRAFT_69031 [Aureococcus anophagefferens]EGB02275.1 hypothetical protein AURANDRAFT_69031 [Aureococcus anophagefferens]|eukprot:XP_009043025.1 hypothetical protein AURANDRAFT_69031 [Aureococcus anophagefferens]